MVMGGALLGDMTGRRVALHLEKHRKQMARSSEYPRVNGSYSQVSGGPGAQHRQLRSLMNHIVSAITLVLPPSFRGRILNLRIYDRYLRTSEAVANHQAGGQ
jgi:hypothetical protein